MRRAGPKGRPDARRRFELLERRFIPGKAKGLKLVVQDDLTGPGGGTWTVKVADGKVRVRAGAATDPDVRYASSVDDYCRLDDGTLDPLRAFLTGRVKIAGDRTAMRRYTGAFRPIDDVL